MIALASVYVDYKILERHLLPHIPESITERYFIQGDEKSNIASLYNQVLGKVKSRFVLFIHPDVEFSPDAIDGMVMALEDGAGAAGLVGVTGNGKYLFSTKIKTSGKVQSLDSCVLAVNKDQGLLFDEKTFNELHLYVEDYCLQVRANGGDCMVVPASKFLHVSVTMLSRGATWGKYKYYKNRFRFKWKSQFGDDIATT